MDIESSGPFAGQAFQDAASRPKAPSGAFDPMPYRPYLANLDITDEQANDLLAILWDIMTRFVDLGWTVDLVCEQVFSGLDLPNSSGSDEL